MINDPVIVIFNLNAVKSSLIELTTRSTSLAFEVCSIKICACERIPRVLNPQGIQVVLHCQHFPWASGSQAQGVCSEVVSPSPVCPSLLFPLFYQCDCLLPSAWGPMARLPGFASYGSSLHLGAGCQLWKHLDASGVQPPLCEAVINKQLVLFLTCGSVGKVLTCKQLVSPLLNSNSLIWHRRNLRT